MNMIKDGRLAAAEALIKEGNRTRALRMLADYLGEAGAVYLAGAVTTAGRGNVGGFSLDDIKALANLDETQAQAVMEELNDDFDPEIGMTWEQIKDTIDELFPGARASLEA